MPVKLRISDLRVGDRVLVSWYPGQVPVSGTIESVIINASRASVSRMRTDAGQSIHLKSSMTIRPVKQEPR